MKPHSLISPWSQLDTVTRTVAFIVALFILLIAGAQLGAAPAHAQPPDSTAVQISNQCCLWTDDSVLRDYQTNAIPQANLEGVSSRVC